jgi:hypothetical protein
MTLREEVEQGIKELLIITPMMKDLHNNTNNQQLFFEHDVIPIDKNKYKKEYDKVLNKLRDKGFTILIA